MTEEFKKLVVTPPPSNNNKNSFTALLELPSNQALDLLTHSSSYSLPFDHNNNLFKRHRISAFTHSLPVHDVKVKPQPLDCCYTNDPTDGNECEKDKTLKRKERAKKGKGSSKKCKMTSEDGEKLPYVHVRARRGQATDSHSLAERVRREKINARMKLLQEIVPGCNKISGTALVLDEIINHVQYLQRQVEYLSMRLAAVNPRMDYNLNSLVPGNETMMNCNYPNMALPLPWPEIPLNDRKQFQQQWHAELTRPVLVASENSLMKYDSSPSNSASLHSSQLKMEL